MNASSTQAAPVAARHISMGVVLTVALAMVAFAGNSLLCRLALKQTSIDPATFTALRLVSGAVVLALLVHLRGGRPGKAGDSISAAALFAYAAAFSFAYVSLSAGTGALLLFGAVQLTMVLTALYLGERPSLMQWSGLGFAAAGLVILLLPGVAAPPLLQAVLMLLAGVAWGVYSLRGRGKPDAAAVTAGNFMRAVPMGIALLLIASPWLQWDVQGAIYALLSGGVASGLGYAIWYSVLRHLGATQAASVQLSVPAITAVGGVVMLNESLTLRLVIASVAILGGIALVLRGRVVTRPSK
jgi:drug/metabolite transporter (DMT)-like permease